MRTPFDDIAGLSNATAGGSENGVSQRKNVGPEAHCTQNYGDDAPGRGLSGHLDLRGRADFVARYKVMDRHF